MIGFRAHPNTVWPHLNFMTFVNTLFPQLRSYWQVLGMRTWTYLCGGYISTRTPSFCYHLLSAFFPLVYWPVLSLLLLLLLNHFSCVRPSVWPHRRQPTRLRRPWDSPGKNTGVGCHFLLQRMKVKSESEVAQSSPTLHDTMDCSPPGSSAHGIFQARVLEWGAIAFSVYLV